MDLKLSLKTLVGEISRIFPTAKDKLTEESNLVDITTFLGSLQSAEDAVSQTDAYQGMVNSLQELKTKVENLESDFDAKVETLVNEKVTAVTGTLSDTVETAVKGKFETLSNNLVKEMGKNFNDLKVNLEDSLKDSTDAVKIVTGSNKPIEGKDDNEMEFKLDATVDGKLVDSILGFN